MIAKINERPDPGATCNNCHNELRSFILQTNQGNQTVFICENENCPRKGTISTIYTPAPETEASSKP